MKHQFVENLQEGDAVNDYFVAARKDLRNTQSGSKFLGCVFKDRTGDIGGVLWNNAAAIAQRFELGDVVNVKGTVGSYQDRLQIRIEQIVPLREEEFSQEDLVLATSDTGEHLKALFAILDTIQNVWLKQLIRSFRDDPSFMERFEGAAAGKKWHHAYRGGLVKHVLELAQIAERVCDVFPQVDRDLVLTGVFLHDIGKLVEISQGLFVDYTSEGRLLGHVVIGSHMAEKRIDAIEGFPADLRAHLQHIVLSHHGLLENGSPVVPRSLEALTLSHVDDLGAQLDAYTRVIEETKARGQNWSEYISMIDRQIWTKEL